MEPNYTKMPPKDLKYTAALKNMAKFLIKICILIWSKIQSLVKIFRNSTHKYHI